jgi:hypothetical protein
MRDLRRIAAPESFIARASVANTKELQLMMVTFCSGGRIPVGAKQFPDRLQKFPCSGAAGNALQAIGIVMRIDAMRGPNGGIVRIP